MEKGYFITGTDTDVGKTWATLALIRYFRNQGKSVAGMKPVASGCFMRDGRLVNDDALQIQAAASITMGYELINPYAYAEPVSPHIAGKNKPAALDKIVCCFDKLKEQADLVLVEGAGGWLTPVNNREDMADLAKMLALPVILVVAIRLGCINHAKLTYRGIQQTYIHCAGWIAACSDPNVLNRVEIIRTLEKAMDAPLLGVLPYRETADFNFFAQQLKL